MSNWTTASGTLEISFAGEAPYDAEDATTLAHDTAAKTFHGDMTGTSTLHMLSAISGTPGSAGYVVIEKVEAALEGRSGHFVLQHFGLMRRGKPELRIEVVPDTGTDGLVGLEGTMTIDIVDGVHQWTFRYRFADLEDPED